MIEFFKSVPVIRGLAHSTPRYHVGSEFENRLGLQVIRAVSKGLWWKLRKPNVHIEIENHRQLLEDDGILILEHFLDNEKFAAVTREFESANSEISLKPYKGSSNAKLFRTQIAVSKTPENFPSIIESFQTNEVLNQIAAMVTRRRTDKLPDVFLDTYQNVNASGFDNDIENVLHADLHCPTVKMFFYLNDVDESNGAFVYAKGSHKLTAQRLCHEYELSIREARLKRKKHIPDFLLAFRGNEMRNVINPKNYLAMSIKETQLRVNANTLVVANNMGFHRRGEFSSNVPRKALLINYRKYERSIL